MPQFAVARVLNVHGDLDYLQRFEVRYPDGRLTWTTICSGNIKSALAHNYRDAAEESRTLAERLVPTFIDGRPILWRVVDRADPHKPLELF